MAAFARKRGPYAFFSKYNNYLLQKDVSSVRKSWYCLFMFLWGWLWNRFKTLLIFMNSVKLSREYLVHLNWILKHTVPSNSIVQLMVAESGGPVFPKVRVQIPLESTVFLLTLAGFENHDIFSSETRNRG